MTQITQVMGTVRGPRLERKAMTRDKREAQICGVIETTAGMYGDLRLTYMNADL